MIDTPGLAKRALADDKERGRVRALTVAHREERRRSTGTPLTRNGMKTIRWSDGGSNEEIAAEAAEVLRRGGLVCLPCGGRYRILSSLQDTDAVMHMMQAKGRVRAAPALIFIHSPDALAEVADDLDPYAVTLARRFWPGPLTLRVHPGRAFGSKVLKQLGGKKSRVGVRIPADAIALATVEAFGEPVLVTSANRERKSGEGSTAQVLKTFGRNVDLFIDAGDLRAGPTSSVIDVTSGGVRIERPGSLDDAILASAAE